MNGQADPYIGQQVIWLEDNSIATVTAFVDEKVGVYELEDNEGCVWAGFDFDFRLVDE